MLREPHQIVQLTELPSTKQRAAITAERAFRAPARGLQQEVLRAWRELDYSHATRYFYQPVSLDKVTRASCSGMQFRSWIQ